MFNDVGKKDSTSSLALVAGSSRSSFLSRFARDEGGAMILLFMFIIMIMLVVGGMAVDVMRNEMERTQLQATVDRAVLAAADLDQELDPQAVVTDYFAKAGMAEYVTGVEVNNGLNFRTVRVDASNTSPTRFMRFLGVEELPVPAVGTAEERVSNVEISMVLDISGSMGWNDKMPNLQTAAKTFVDTVLKPESADLISISMVPYTAQVNAGWEIFQHLNIVEDHPYSYCVDFDQSDFNETEISLSDPYEHMQHFEAGWNRNTSRITNPGCPDATYENISSSSISTIQANARNNHFETIQSFSQSPTDLKATIDQYRARANTAIHLGMKWGVAMLDPAFRPVVQDMVADGDVDNAFSPRPASYEDYNTLKTVILMTDGENVDTYRIDPSKYQNWNHARHWDRYPLFWYLNRYVYSSQWHYWRYKKYTSSQADQMLDSICDAAKTKGIIVWSVGFEVSDHSAGVMENCASTPSHFFRVEGVEISAAFEAIAKQINQLRLTQ